jgi:hypothetical protein
MLYSEGVIKYGSNELLPANNCSEKWHLENVQIKCDIITLDNAVQNQHAQHLLDGKSLPIAFDTFINQFQLVSGLKNAINLTRAVSRLKSVFITHYADLSTLDDQVATKLEPHVYKTFNTFYHPAYANNTGNRQDNNDWATDMRIQVQIGSNLYPEDPIKSGQEAFYQLRKCLGLHNTEVFVRSILDQENTHG